MIPNRLYRIPEVQERYIAELRKMLAENWNEEELNAEFDRVEELLQDHVMESNTGFTRSLAAYRSFLKTRRRVLERELKDGAPELTSAEQLPIYFSNIGTASITFDTKWYDKTPRNASDMGEATIKLVMDGEEVEVTDVAGFSELSKWPTPGEPPASIVIRCKRASDGKVLVFGTGIERKDFSVTGDDPVNIGGIFMVGGNFMPGGKMTMLAGNATLEATSMEDGESVKGKMEISIMRMQGGEPVDR